MMTRRPLAVVTGAGLAMEAADRSMCVVLADRDETGLAATERELRARFVPVLAVQADTGDAASIDALAEQTPRAFGPVALLVNNAGIELTGKVWEFAAGDLDRIVRINLLGAMHTARAFVPGMIAAGSQARIVNMASLEALDAMPPQTAHILTKQALRAFFGGLELELRRFAPFLHVSVALSGAIDTLIFELATATDPKQVDAGRFWISCHNDQLASLARLRRRKVPSYANRASTKPVPPSCTKYRLTARMAG